MAKKRRTDERDSTRRKKGSAGIATPPDMRTLLARARRSPVVKAARDAIKRVTGRRSTASAPAAAEAVANDASDHGRPMRNAAEKTKDRIKTNVDQLAKYDDDGEFYSSSDSNMSEANVMSEADVIHKLHNETHSLLRQVSDLRAKIIEQTNMVADPEDIAILQDMLGAFGGLGIYEDDEEDYVSDWLRRFVWSIMVYNFIYLLNDYYYFSNCISAWICNTTKVNIPLKAKGFKVNVTDRNTIKVDGSNMDNYWGVLGKNHDGDGDDDDDDNDDEDD